MRLGQRTTDWVTHIFREHNQEADFWAGKGAQGRAEEWVDTTRITWREVYRCVWICDGSFNNGRCGGGINGWKSAPAKSVQLFERYVITSLSSDIWWKRDYPTAHFADDTGAEIEASFLRKI